MVSCRYGTVECRLAVRFPGAGQVELAFELPAATTRHAQVQAGFTLRVPAGAELAWSAAGTPPVAASDQLDPLRTTGFSWRCGDGYTDRRLRGPGWSLQMPEESACHWPAYPFNPYAINDAAPPEAALVAISAGFTAGRRRVFLLSVG